MGNPEDDATGLTRREGPTSERSSRAATDVSAPEYLSRGTLVGRYVALDVLGEGGMGVVYRAFDPELDRKVAIKLLQARPSEGSTAGGQTWLVREAQALARLSHPNVVAVHDVGTLPGDRVFVAMELVDGITLRRWLKAEPRSWRQVVPVLRAAGAGLAAAHAAGLVHRDFKPENVIVGHDGRVRVMDFGLARLRPDEEAVPAARRSELQIETRSPLSANLTVAGHVVGTPVYLAPEIYQGHPADAKTDQFAFGVALYEALFHARPFDRADLVAGRRPRVPETTDVPAAIRRVVLRALEPDPAARFATMDDLLAELATDPTARRRRIAIAAGIVVAASAIGGGVFVVARQASSPCTGAERRLAGVWDAPTRAAIEKAFLATKRPFAPQAWAGLARALDRYAQDWAAASTGSCEATRVRGEQSEEVLSLRQTCLDQRLEELRALTHMLADADAQLVEKGDKVAFQLEPLATCANVTALRAPGLPAPEIRPKLAALDKQLAEARADLIVAHYLPALVKSKAALDGATALHWEPMVGDALFVRGAANLAVANMTDAAQAFADATWAGMRGKRDDLVARAALSTAMVTSDALGRPAEAQVWIDLASAARTRIGIDHQLEIQHDQTAGMVAAELGDLTSAVELHEKAFATAQLVWGKDGAALASVENDLAATLSRAGAFARAAEHYEHALALRKASVGDDHPDIALILSNLGLAYRHLHRKEARDMFERALAMRERFYGKNSPILTATLDNYAEYLAQEGDHAGALAMVERARTLAAVLPGPTHPMYHQLLTDYAEILAGAGKLDEARAMLDDTLKLERDNKSATLAATLAVRAELALREQQVADAESYATRSIATYEASGGKEAPGLWRPLTALAQAKIADGHAADARPLLERALAIGTKAGTPPDDLAPTRAALSALPP